MRRHGFDMFSFLAGVFFLAVSVPLLFSDVDLTPYRGRWVVPGILLIAGLVMLGSGLPGAAGSESQRGLEAPPELLDEEASDF